jgi:hypothetical protein
MSNTRIQVLAHPIPKFHEASDDEDKEDEQDLDGECDISAIERNSSKLMFSSSILSFIAFLTANIFATHLCIT